MISKQPIPQFGPMISLRLTLWMLALTLGVAELGGQSYSLRLALLLCIASAIGLVVDFVGSTEYWQHDQ